MNPELPVRYFPHLQFIYQSDRFFGFEKNSEELMNIRPVSIHGGHSGQFCDHARDTLEALIRAYISQGFAWVGITEHMPPPNDTFLSHEERYAGLNAKAIQSRFGDYIDEARRCQKAFQGQIEILVGFETEAYPGGVEYALYLMERYRPDFIVGSVHHLGEIPFDFSADEYKRAAEAAGGTEQLYCRYFDLQHDMIQALRPSVVAHFDLIRIFDPDYPRHLQLPAVVRRIERNLELIARLDLILDYNVAALRKGAREPYIAQPILHKARRLGISVVPGDDSHSVDTVGSFVQQGILILSQMGFDLNWRKPAI
jgi:histidinol-phosphatase (PHP family)